MAFLAIITSNFFRRSGALRFRAGDLDTHFAPFTLTPVYGLQPYFYQYLLLAAVALLALLFACAPLLLAALLAPRKPNRTKAGTFECGLEAKGDPWMRFQVQ